MRDYKVISVDMFQTLVDVSSRRHEVFKRILEDLYNKELAEECWEEANKILSSCLKKYVTQSTSFYTIKSVFESCYQELFPQKGIKLDPKKGAEILANEHGYANSYLDTEVFMDAVKKHYPVCLVSDTDYDMVYPLLDRFQFDKVFLSEEFQCYKNSQQKSVFEDVLSYYKVQPSEIIHIGDSIADVAGAKSFGITTCWLNRNGNEWIYDIKPDYIASSLIEVAKLIGIEVENIA
ncbi:MAG: HAD family hydrolase [Bacillota bacterium]